MEQTSSQPTSSTAAVYNGFLKALPVIQWIMTVALVIGGYALYFRDSQTIQAQGLRETAQKLQTLENLVEQRKNDRDKQILEIKQEIKQEIDKTLKRETFDVFQRNWDERQTRFDEKLDRILERQK